MAVNIEAIGNVGAQPRPVKVKGRVAGFSVSVCATPRRRANKASDEWEDYGEPIWLRATFWKNADDWPANRDELEGINKGSRVKLSGSLSIQEYDGKLYYEVSFPLIEAVRNG